MDLQEHNPARDLRQQFNETPEPQKQPNSNEQLLTLVGITRHLMGETIISDICQMIKQGLKEPLNGYVYCLSRIVDKNIAWGYISTAFKQMKQSIPAKYFVIFNKEEKSEDKNLVSE